MAVVGNITVRVQAVTRAFEQRMIAAQRSVRRFRVSMRQMTTVTGIATAAIGAFLFGTVRVVKRLSDIAIRTATARDEVVKFARSIGVSVQELQQLQFAGEIAGVKTTVLRLAMQRMRRRASEAAKGLGEAKGALRELHIDAVRFSKLGLSDQVDELAAAFKRVRNGADRTRLAMRLFDTEGVRAVNVLTMPDRQRRQLMAEAAVLTERQVRATEALVDAQTRYNEARARFDNSLLEQSVSLTKQWHGALSDLYAVAERFDLGRIHSFLAFIVEGSRQSLYNVELLGRRLGQLVGIGDPSEIAKLRMAQISASYDRQFPLEGPNGLRSAGDNLNNAADKLLQAADTMLGIRNPAMEFTGRESIRIL